MDHENTEDTVKDHDYWIHRLSEVVDGTLDPEEARAADAHLAECASCRDAVVELRRIVEEAGSLGGVAPSRDLWPAIEAELTPREADVLVFPAPGPDGVADGAGKRAAGRFVFSGRELVAAAAVLVLVSSLLTWWAAPAPRPDAVPGASGPSAAAPAATPLDAPPELAAELDALSRALAEEGSRLEPETRRVIEKNLAVIERAIEDSRRALAMDPANAYLQEHLDRAYERKLSYLQEAAAIAEWASS